MRIPPEVTSIKSTRSIVELILENTVSRVDTWNSLPAKLIESNTINGFKNQLNSHWKDLEIKFRQDIHKPEVTNGYDQSGAN